MKREEIIQKLIEQGESPDRASFYTDAYIEYKEASANLQEHGAIVQHPRTANPITNPYLAIRDRALKRLLKLKIRADFLWD